MKKKGQAAKKFFMTYGWIILLAIIVIGILAYSGVFTPKKEIGETNETAEEKISETVEVTPPLYVNALSAKASTGITLELANNGSKTYSVTSVDIDGCGAYSNATEINASASETITIACSPTLIEDEDFEGNITIKYAKSGSDVELILTETIAEKITA
ncbi:MAG: hypothetical protein KJ767_04200 [Nanoarchaeota archaeon]|nr:hypothetical protein [Nanoarchaeota archaeon]